MMVSEAKTKVCPFIQHLSVAADQSNTYLNDYSHVNIYCICGDCMAWVYTPTQNFVLVENERHGYCARIGQ